MAREEQAREDLLAEATALVTRVEFRLAGDDTIYVAGFRRNGAFSLFCGEDPVFQFNTRGELRRGYWRGTLLKAERGQLIELRRCRVPGEVQLVRRELSPNETATVTEHVRSRLGQLLQAIRANEAEVLRQVSPDGNALARIDKWIESLGEEVSVAVSPRVA